VKRAYLWAILGVVALFVVVDQAVARARRPW
jgi:hypothetical protein